MQAQRELKSKALLSKWEECLFSLEPLDEDEIRQLIIDVCEAIRIELPGPIVFQKAPVHHSLARSRANRFGGEKPRDIRAWPWTQMVGGWLNEKHLSKARSVRSDSEVNILMRRYQAAESLLTEAPYGNIKVSLDPSTARWHVEPATKFLQPHIFTVILLDLERKIYRTDAMKPEIPLLVKLVQKTSGRVFICEDKVVVMHRPTFMSFDEDGRLHNEEKEAVRYRSGKKLYMWHGRLVPQEAVISPEKIKLRHISSEKNVEVRRILVERYGIERYIVDSKADEIKTDTCGTLYFKYEPWPEEPICMLRVTNSTPEPDGTFKDYFIRVPPHMHTVRQALAWTFDLKEHEYSPVVET